MRRFALIGSVLLVGSQVVQAANVRVQPMEGGGSRSDAPGYSASESRSAARVEVQERTRVIRRETSGPVRNERPRSVNRQRSGSVRVQRNVGVTYTRSNARVRVVPRTGNWHYSRDGRRYLYRHYRGHPWYGYYRGSHFYWTRYHANHWWWYDTQYARWSIWWNGYWWWAAPGGVTYVYMNNAYYPYNAGVLAVSPPPAMAAPEEIGAPEVPEAAQAVTPSSYKSPDGSRMVQVAGPNGEAFLYETSTGKSVYLRYLTKNVERVRFAGGGTGGPLQILVDFKGSARFALFDEEGNPLDETRRAAERTAAQADIPHPPAEFPE